MAVAGLGSDPLELLVCPLSICRLSFSKVFQYVLDGFFAPSAVQFQPSDFTSSGYTIYIPNEKFCTVVSHSEPNTDSVQKKLWTFALPTLSHQMGQIIVTGSCHAVFRVAFSRHDLFHTWTKYILHVPPTTAVLVNRHRVVLVCCSQCDI